MLLKTLGTLGKTKEQIYSSLYLLGFIMASGLLVSACKPNEQKSGVQPPGNVRRDTSSAQSLSESVKPKLNFVATEKLYEKIKQKKLGSGSGLIRIDENIGILIRPGLSPTEVTFDVSGMKETLKFAFWIGQFTQDEVSLSEKATAGFEVFVNGKSLGRKRVDRLTNQALLVNPLGVSRLRIVVDNDNGDITGDRFFMGLQ